jgi:hypothetical protein
LPLVAVNGRLSTAAEELEEGTTVDTAAGVTVALARAAVYEAASAT